MLRLRSLLLPAALLLPVVLPLTAQTTTAPTAFPIEPGPPGVLRGWAAGPAGAVVVDSAVSHSAPYSARLESRGAQAVLSRGLPITFVGDTIEIRGWLRTAGVIGSAGLWLREDGRSGRVQLDNMEQRQLRGTTEWTQYSIKLPLDARARSVLFGALLTGEGTVWADDIELLVDGRPLSQAPRRTVAQKPAEQDQEFNAGSRFTATSLTRVQVENLALLGRVWGFAKYHHPSIAAGATNWDYELFRVLPAVAAAADRAAAAGAIVQWLDRLGPPAACSPCVQPPAEAHLRADLAWIADRATLGNALVARLQEMHARRTSPAEHFYIAQNPGVGNADFSAESDYPGQRHPDTGYRLLALFRFWNIIEYWFPYRDVIGEDWRGVLTEFVPRFVAAQDGHAYRLELLQLIARIHDTHANLWSDLNVRPPVGDALLPVVLRFVEGRAVVTDHAHPSLGPASGLQRGDVITHIAGAPVDSLVTAWRPYYAASNEPTRLRDIARFLTRGSAGPVSVRVRRGGRELDLQPSRVPAGQLNQQRGSVHDLPGPAFQRLSEEVAYLKLSAVVMDSVPSYIERAQGAKVLVLDNRNYPSAFIIFALGGRLVTQPTPFATFTAGELANPGTFTWGSTVSLTPMQPRFQGRVVVLVDEVTQSSAEYHSMAFRSVPGAVVVGSTTAGADGNVSTIPLPGASRAMISGIGVFYPDRRPTQRVGIVPDIEVKPTIAGITAGRDEVLEAGVSHALGRAWTLPAR